MRSRSSKPRRCPVAWWSHRPTSSRTSMQSPSGCSRTTIIRRAGACASRGTPRSSPVRPRTSPAARRCSASTPTRCWPSSATTRAASPSCARAARSADEIGCHRTRTQGGRMKGLLSDFRKFVMRGNVLDLAVAVIIGIAFNAVVNSLVNDVIMQIIAAIVGKPNFDDLTFALGDGIIYYGKFLTALINFLIIAATLFVIIRSFEELQKRRRGTDEELEEAPEDIVLLTEIRDLLAQNAGNASGQRPPVS